MTTTISLITSLSCPSPAPWPVGCRCPAERRANGDDDVFLAAAARKIRRRRQVADRSRHYLLAPQKWPHAVEGSGCRPTYPASVAEQMESRQRAYVVRVAALGGGIRPVAFPSWLLRRLGLCRAHFDLRRPGAPSGGGSTGFSGAGGRLNALIASSGTTSTAPASVLTRTSCVMI